MADPMLLYALAGIAILLSAVAAAGAWRPNRAMTCLAEAKLEELLGELKGGLVSELAGARAAVESGMRDSAEAYIEAQRVLAEQIDAAVLRLRAELLDANAESLVIVQQSLEKAFAKSQLTLDRSLADQVLMLKDLKMNYERAIADLRAAVNQASARHGEALGGIGDQVQESLADLSEKMQKAAVNFSRLDERMEAILNSQDAHEAERV